VRKAILATLLLAATATLGEEPPPIGTLVDIGGRKLHLVCMGSGSPVVIFESGAAEAFYSWWLLQQELRKDLRTCSYDRAGFGWSDPPPARSVASYVEDLHALLRKAGEKPPFILVGHSFGGTIVQRYYWRYPKEVAAIIGLDPSNAEADFPPFPAYKEAARAHRARRTREMEEWRAKDTWPVQGFPDQLPEDLRKKLIAKSPSRNWWEARFGEGDLPDAMFPLPPEKRKVGVPLWIITATRSTKPDGWSDETFAAWREHYRLMHEELISRSTRGKRIDAPTSHSVQLDAPAFVADHIRAMVRLLATDNEK
jgi:pimeloyl-ACP methyl ester carboxylesterase